MESLGGYAFVYAENAEDAEIDGSIQPNSYPSNVPPPAPLDDS